MCTAATYYTRDHYFGRNFDLEFSYKETVTVTPRNYRFAFRRAGELSSHYAMIGMAFVMGDYPLYYDAVNEKGLGMAGLNFPGNADYKEAKEGAVNVASFELIPYIIAQCANVAEAREALAGLNVTDDNFSEELPASPLHWIISDKETSITVESVKDGLKVYDNPMGVLTNNPTFDIQSFNLNNYMSLSPKQPENGFAAALDLEKYSRGMGALGLPGDLSSASRFVKAVYTKMNSLSGEGESASISQFFHVLESVFQQRGCVLVGDKYEITIYSCCCNLDKGIYYYKTYENSRITGVDMFKEDLSGSELVSYELLTEQDVLMQN